MYISIKSNPIALVFLTALLISVSTPSQAYTLPQAESVPQNKIVLRTVLINNLSQDPKKLAFAHTSAYLKRKGLTPDQQSTFMKSYKENYEFQESLVLNGRLPPAGVADETLIKLTNWAFERTIDVVAPGFGSAAGILFEGATEHYIEHVSKDSVKSAGDYLADRAYDSVVNVERNVDYILNTPGMREDLVSYANVDINDPDTSLLAKNPDVANVFLNQSAITKIVDTQRTLSEIKVDIENSDANNTALLEDLGDELKLAIKSGLSFLNENISNDIQEIGNNQLLLDEKIDNTAKFLGDEIGKNRQLLTTLIDDINLREKKREDARILLEDNRKEAAKVRAYLQAGSFLLDQIEPGLGEKVSVTINSTIAISKAIKAFKAVSDIDTSALISLGTGMINPTMAIFAVLQSTGPSTDQLILEQLAAIKQSIEDLRTEMHERLDIVDLKLDTILSELSNGFELVESQLAVNLDAIAYNSRIGLDTQSLIISESDRIANIVRDYFLVPCTKRGLNNRTEISDHDFEDCVSRLAHYSISQLKTDQVAYDVNASSATITNLLTSTDERTADLLYSLYSNQTGNTVNTDIMVDPVEWQIASKWYSDFLSDRPEQTIRTKTIPRINELLLIGERISTYRQHVLNDFKDTNLVLNNPLKQYIQHGYNTSDRLRDIIDKKMTLYFSSKAFALTNIEQRLNELPSDEATAINPTLNLTVWAAPANITINPAGINALLSKVPTAIKAGAINGMGSIRITLEYVETTRHRYNCGFLNREGCFVADYDNWVAHVYYDQAPQIGIPSQHIGKLSFIYPDTTSGDIDFGTGFIPAGPKFCVTSSCLGNKIASTINNYSHDSGVTTTLVSKFDQTWDENRQKIAELVLTDMSLKQNNDDTHRENAYFSSLVKLAFTDILSENDGLFQLAKGGIGLPTYSELKSIILKQQSLYGDSYGLGLIWGLDEIIDDEVGVLEEYLLSGEITMLANKASAQESLSFTIFSLKNAETFLEQKKTTPDAFGDEPPPTTESPTGSSSSGSSTNIYFLSLLFFALLAPRLNYLRHYRRYKLAIYF